MHADRRRARRRSSRRGPGRAPRSRGRSRPRPRRGRSRRAPCRRAARPSRGRRCASRAPASRRSRRWAAGGSPPRCRRRRRRRRGRSGSCRGRSAIASAPEAQALTRACGRRLGRRARATTAAAGPLGISIGTVSGKTRRGPFSRERVPRVEQGPDAADAGCRRRRRGARGRSPACRRRPRPRGTRPGRTGATGRAGGSRPWRGRPTGATASCAAKVTGQLVLVHPVLVSVRAPDRPARMASQVSGDVAAEGGGGTESGDDDASLLRHGLSCSLVGMAVAGRGAVRRAGVRPRAPPRAPGGGAGVDRAGQALRALAMKVTASPTVLRFLTSSSGMRRRTSPRR